eukprot:jgi/Ulvmu1/7972/UM004_0205.1
MLHGLPLQISPEVQKALRLRKGVVALESTIISHGMPYPQNLQTAKRVEHTVREGGAVPATIAIINHKCCIGLDDKQLEALARHGLKCVKVSRRDILPVLTSGEMGATTVAATMLLASAAGVRVFVTGGIGGVHRGVERTMDVSADLTELGRTPVAVVCAGVKTILDIPKTLEYLETQGVTVAAHGTDDFPAFFVPSSGLRAPLRIDCPSRLAAIVRRLPALGSGMVIAVPIPAADEELGRRLQAHIDTALREAEAQNVMGAGITPFVLERVRALTGGKSLEANIRLVLNNARAGARIAVEAAAQEARQPSKL